MKKIIVMNKIFLMKRLGKAKNCWWMRMAVKNDEIRPAV